jgi:hypothetical protein
LLEQGCLRHPHTTTVGSPSDVPAGRAVAAIRRRCDPTDPNQP